MLLKQLKNKKGGNELIICCSTPTSFTSNGSLGGRSGYNSPKSWEKNRKKSKKERKKGKRKTKVEPDFGILDSGYAT